MGRRVGVVAVLFSAIAVMWLTAAGISPPPVGESAGVSSEAAIATSLAASTSPVPSTSAAAELEESAPAPSVTATTRPVREVAEQPQPDPAPSAPGVAPGFGSTGVATVAAGGAELAAAPGAPATVRAREGLSFPILGIEGSWYRILTTCDREAWVREGEVYATPPAPGAAIGPGFAMADATVVIDPGHGGPNIGTSSPDGALLEKDINIDIARRARDLLERSAAVDWESGMISDGTEVAAAARVVMTRTGDAAAADYEAGLIYRAALANAAGAHVMVSIHNNAGWEIAVDGPGSDVYYQSQIAASRRLGELLVEELRRSFEPFEAAWVGAAEQGAKSRLSPRDGVSQYYGLLRRAAMPTVIAEGAYLASGPEAQLLATAEFRQAYAEAVYRAIVRFLTTADVAEAPSYDPVVWAGFAGSGDATGNCRVPAQGN